MGNESIIRPNLTVLSEGQKEKIHSESLKILSSMGIRFESERARKVFSKNIGPSAVSEDLVYIPSEIVEEAIKMAPSSFNMYNRKGELAFKLPGNTQFGIGVGTLYFQDPETDIAKPFMRKHMETCVRLGERLTSFNAVSTIGIIQDVPIDVLDLYEVLEMTANTIKPLVILISNESAMSDVLDLLEHLHGDLISKPFVIPYFNPITPRVLNRGTSDKIFVTIEKGLPFIYSNAGMAGGTTPITHAGTLTLMNAELLAGLVFSQLIKERTPIMLGSIFNYMDMRDGEPVPDSIRMLMNLVCAEMMAYYDIPHFGSTGGGLGWGADLVNCGYQWFNDVVSCIGKVGLISFVGGTFRYMVFTPNHIVYANEVIEQARRFSRGFIIDDTTIALDEIAETDPGGNFLITKLTLKHFYNAYYQSDIFPQLTLEVWKEKGCTKVDGVLRQYTMDLINDLTAPSDHGDLIEQGEAFISKLKI